MLKSVLLKMFVLTYFMMYGEVMRGAPPSDYAKNTVLLYSKKLNDQVDPLYRQYKHFKESNRLMEIDNGSLREVSIVSEMGGVLSSLIQAYNAAIDSGWPETDPELKKVKDQIIETRAKMEKYGMWLSFQFGEELIAGKKDFGLETYRNMAWHAFLVAKIGQVDKSVSEFQELDKRIRKLNEDIDELIDEGKTAKDVPFIDLPKHPAYKRMQKEIQKFKDIAKPLFAEQEKQRGVIDNDVHKLQDMYTQCDNMLRQAEKAVGASGAMENMLKQYEETVELMNSFDKDELVSIKEYITEFEGKYGTDQDKIFGNIHSVRGSKHDYVRSPASTYYSLNETIRRYEEIRPIIAKKIYEYVNSGSQAVYEYRKNEFDERFNNYEGNVELALEYLPGDANLEQLKKELSSRRDKAWADINAKIDTQTWAGHSDTFQGPGDPDDLAEEALEWAKRDAGWTENETPLAVRVTGDWQVGKKNILGAVISWRLPIELATQKHVDLDAGSDVIWSFNCSIYTRDAEKSPPWASLAVGSNRKLRKSNISGMSGGGKGPNILFRLALSISLILSGLLVASGYLKGIDPKFEDKIKKIIPLKAVIGTTTLGLGLFFLIKNILLLSPFADLLPQALAVVVGLYLGYDILVSLKFKEPVVERESDGADKDKLESITTKAVHSVSEGTQKLQKLIVDNTETIKGLQKYDTLMGISSIVLGFVHLLFAGWPLF